MTSRLIGSVDAVASLAGDAFGALARDSEVGRRRARAAALGLGGVAGAVALRWMLLRSHVEPGLDGVLFAVALLALAAVVRAITPAATKEAITAHAAPAIPRPPQSTRWRTGAGLVLGVFGGAVLVAIPIAARLPGSAALAPAARPDVALPAWVAVTVLVAVSEEVLFRGALFDLLITGRSMVVAVALTSLLFALVHVPFYGWAALPVDLAAGIWLAGLRLVSGGLVAPSAAHVLADLATWWM